MNHDHALQTAERYHDLLGEQDRRDELARLTTLTEELDPATERRLEALDPQPTWRCLEIGAGTGTIAAWLARRCPRGRVVATDVDLRFLGDRGLLNLEPLEHDVTVDDLPAASFDLIHARYVFAHLRERDSVLRRVASWLAPGGWLILEEPARFPIESSPHADYRDVTLAALDAFQSRLGTDTHWSLLFPDPLAVLGLERLAVNVSGSVVGGARPMGRFWAATLNLLDHDAYFPLERARIERVKDLMYRPHFHDLGLATIAAWGQRP
jgi:SAM-dependent methyltransferase